MLLSRLVQVRWSSPSISALLVVLLFVETFDSSSAFIDTGEPDNGKGINYAPSSSARELFKRAATKSPATQISESTTTASAKIANQKTTSTKPTLKSLSTKTKKGTRVPSSNATSLLTTGKVHFDARDVTYFLESHPAHSVYDPRVYFTEERASRSLAIMLQETHKLPSKLRFAFVVRVFNELGRKIASKFNYYATEVAAILRKTPDDLGNKPEVSMLVDVVNNAFESKEDGELTDNGEDNITPLIQKDIEKSAVFNSSMNEIATRFAHIISYFALNVTQTSIKFSKKRRESMASLLSESLQFGAKTLIRELSKSDKYRVPNGTVTYAHRILNMTMIMFKRHIRDNHIPTGISSSFKATDAKSFNDLNKISDKTGLIGTWNNFLFTNLGTSERVIKLFAALLSRVPPEAQTRWINMYIGQVNTELGRTLSGFVVMQGMPYNRNESEMYLLDPMRSAAIMPVKLPKPRANYLDDKNRIPARCYLAGRRWRFILSRALQANPSRDEVIVGFADQMSKFKLKMINQSGNEIYRLCLPRVEVGLRGWGINGDPQADGSQSSKFPFKNPINGLETMDDPFASGAKLGYRIGFKVGYNEERNATLELEAAGITRNNIKERAESEIGYLAKASYRHAATVSAKKAFEIAIREGYMTTLKISMRAGMFIPAEASSRLASLKCTSFAGQVGQEAGRSVIDTYLADKQMSETMRSALIKVGESEGLLAGEVMGQAVGAIVGKEAGIEAYKRCLIRGGRATRAKFHLEEYEVAGNLGYDYGLKEGKRVASSSTLDPSAPKFFRLAAPVFSATDKRDHEVDHWEKDLIPDLSGDLLSDLQYRHNHTTVSGIMRGVYRHSKEVKNGLKRVSFTNTTYKLEVTASGFIMDDIAYLNLNGTINKTGIIRGSVIARDIFNDDVEDDEF